MKEISGITIHRMMTTLTMRTIPLKPRDRLTRFLRLKCGINPTIPKFLIRRNHLKNGKTPLLLRRIRVSKIIQFGFMVSKTRMVIIMHFSV